MPIVKIKGIPKELGGTTYIVPPLSLGALEQLHEKLGTFAGDVSDLGQVATVIDAAHAALRRNYPDMTREQVADMVDVSNMLELFEAVMDISGARRKAHEAEAAAGGAATGEG
jgi:hypothetical protein